MDKIEKIHPGYNPYKEFWRRLKKNRNAVFGLIIILFFLLIAFIAPIVAPYSYTEQFLDKRLTPPRREFILGTDDLGRDILSRIIFGSRISLFIGVISVGISLSIGTILGSTSGYFSGKIDNIVMRLMDIMLSFPSFLLAVMLVGVFGPSLNNAMIAIGIVRIPFYARIVRSSVLSAKEEVYVEAARALGFRDDWIIFRHILPNCLAPIIVQSTLGIASAILEAAGLSFLGLGAQPPSPEWGALVSGGRAWILTAPWLVTFPGIAIFLTVLGFNLFGDGLRDALDPRLRGLK